MKKLLIIGGSAGYLHNDKIYCVDTFHYFIDYLSKHFEHIIYCLPVFSKLTKDISSISTLTPLEHNSSNVEIFQTFPTKTVISYYKNIFSILKKDFSKMKNAVKKSDIVFLRIPSITTLLGFILAKIYKKETVTYYASDIKKVVLTGSKYSGLTRFFAHIAAYIHYHLFKFISEHSKVSLFLSSDLMNQHQCPNSFYTFCSLINEEDLLARKIDESPSPSPLRLLYVGRLTHEKGLPYLIQAAAALKERGIPFHLTLAGEGLEKESLMALVENLNLTKFVSFVGYIKHGKDLDEIFIENDIFILPSLSEGSPKVLIEAMCKSLALICTNVGGIPDMVTNHKNGILIPPASSTAIANAVAEVAASVKLREKLSCESFRYAEEHTAKNQAAKIASLISSHIS